MVKPREQSQYQTVADRYVTLYRDDVESLKPDIPQEVVVSITDHYREFDDLDDFLANAHTVALPLTFVFRDTQGNSLSVGVEERRSDIVLYASGMTPLRILFERWGQIFSKRQTVPRFIYSEPFVRTLLIIGIPALTVIVILYIWPSASAPFVATVIVVCLLVATLAFGGLLWAILKSSYRSEASPPQGLA